MSQENLSSKETLTTVSNELRRRLGQINLRVDVHDGGEAQSHLTIEGAINHTEYPGKDEDIEFVLGKMQKLFPQFTFTYDRLGNIAIDNKPQQTH